MTVKERVLASRLVERAERNRKLATKIGLECGLRRGSTGSGQNPNTEKKRCMMEAQNTNQEGT